MTIRYLTYDEIDKDKWDASLIESDNALIYANSWYLDVVCPGWHALVADDYEAIFPLPVKKKLGISYIVHPLFAQQLGLFASGSGFSVDDFVKAIPNKFHRIILRLNHGYLSKLNVTERMNLVLPLSDLEGLQSRFNKNTKRNIKKSLELTVETDPLNVDDFIDLKRKHSGAGLSNEEWSLMKRLIEKLLEKNCGYFRSVKIKDELISSVFFSEWNGRIYYLFSASSEAGKEVSASFAIVAQIIKEKAKKNMVLDFEGSMSENIARFFRGFGAQEESYCELKKSLR